MKELCGSLSRPGSGSPWDEEPPEGNEAQLCAWWGRLSSCQTTCWMVSSQQRTCTWTWNKHANGCITYELTELKTKHVFVKYLEGKSMWIYDMTWFSSVYNFYSTVQLVLLHDRNGKISQLFCKCAFESLCLTHSLSHTQSLWGNLFT